jgi:hypothetical protein
VTNSKSKNMIQKIILICLSVGFFQLARSQSISPQVIANSGKYMNAGGNSMEFTVGELVVATTSGTGSMLTQGFHQTYTTTSSIDEIEVTIAIKVYPNPTADWLNIIVETGKKVEFVAVIRDGYGRKVLDECNSNGSQLQLNLSTLAAGSYFISLVNIENNIPIKTFQIQKLSNQ